MASYDRPPGDVLVLPKPFKTAIPQTKIDDFKTLLRLSPVAEPTYENTQEDRRYGITAKWLAEAKEQWLHSFDWKQTEDKINSFPNFTIPVSHSDGTDYTVHFVALFSQKPDAIPVILLHGWPGSFLEFLPILSIIKWQFTPATLPYHFIVPSLPGYAFSSPPPLNKNFGIQDIAQLMNQLMLNLGFGSGYVAQGGDIGAKVSRVLGARHDACKAVHLNFCMMKDRPKAVTPNSVSGIEQEGLKRMNCFLEYGTAYALEHATRPSTIGLVLASNPLALLAWIGEKFLDWSDVHPPLQAILESVSLYWFTQTFPRSIYTYRERFDPAAGVAHEHPEWRINKPMGYSWFPKEVAPMPRAWVATTGGLVFWREHEQGGHFAAMEQPELLLEDLREFIEQVWTEREFLAER